MVGCLILYDHIDENGAFVRESPINLRAVVNVIKEQTQPPQTDALLNAIRYTSKHFSHASTPKSTDALLNAIRYTSKHFSHASTPKSVRAILA
ncbi:hypothetical protein OESDEN_04243 [Oesophagostomum dentatum]|uniref:CYRIA/CYRIB Rac1 binding domain-containing protein n=1 Tax=Oesophagostomum dentatum TaxID=61180 RepID=A0A0B1TEW4_OESDE|nr:hypothetical protein OESDEN_04243 [Oesophagostomum dentatum]